MFTRIGELLVRYGELSSEELSMILAEQRRSYRPFGRIASEMFDVHETAIWRAWSEQYAQYCPTIDLETEYRDPAVSDELNAEDAWEHRLLPLRKHDGELIMVTTIQKLALALHFIDKAFEHTVTVWLAEQNQLEATLEEVYPRRTWTSRAS